ncbi:MAG: choice-of-anchor J domain-containing protein, partial [candidate division WOR-3 bacterium]|nr:choice-of-anchor J domain-containing protein [candidate division WOR-3 bacterium]
YSGIGIGNINKWRTTANGSLEMVIAGGTTGSQYPFLYQQTLQFNNDATLTGISFVPSVPIIGDEVTVRITITNTGYQPISTLPVYYRYGNNPLVSELVTFDPPLNYTQSATYDFVAKIGPLQDTVTVAVKCSLGLAGDQYVADDFGTANLKAYYTLAGTYTVGLSGDYSTITAALTDWRERAITGNVTFELINASYTSETYPLTINAPKGYRGGNWNLTIKPATGVSPTIEASNATAIFDLNGVVRVTIDGYNGVTNALTISNTNTSGATIRFINGASYNTITNCVIKGVVTTSTSGIILFSTSTAATGNNYNTINNCDITSGATFAANAIIGNGSASPRWNQYNTVQNCRIYDFSANGIYAYANENYFTYKNNEIYTTRQQTSTGINGINVYGTTTWGDIIGNKIYDFWTSGSSPIFRGIYLFYASTTIPTNVVNNMIYLDAARNHSTATIYGIHERSGTGYIFNIYYNSIYIGGTATSGYGYGIYRGFQSTMNVRNNIIYVARSGGSGQYGIYAFNTGSGFVSNYNDIFVPNGHVGYWNANRTDLAAWRAASNQDANSISANPDFVSATNLHINTNSLTVNRKATPITGITTDIDGDARHPNYPDIGADEYTPIAPSAPTLVSPASNAQNVPLTGNLVWTAGALNEYFDVYLGTTNPPPKVASFVSGTVYPYSGLQVSTKYYWKIVAWNDTGPSDVGYAESPVDSFVTANPPNAPSNLQITITGATTLEMEWTDNSTDEDSFFVYQSTNGINYTKIASLAANTTTYGVSGLTPNTRYWYEVRAFNISTGLSDPARDDDWTWAEVPGALTISGVSYTKLKITLNLGNNPATTEFVVRVRYGSETRYVNPLTGALSTTEIWGNYAQFGGAQGKMVIGLMPSITYTFDVKARNGAGIQTVYGPVAEATTLAPLTLPFSESFEATTFPPTGWDSVTVVYVSGTRAQFSRVTSGSNPTCSPYNGSAMVMFNSYSASSGNQARLWTPPITLNGNLIKLRFAMYHDPGYPTNYDSLYVEISTDYGLSWTVLGGYGRYAATAAWSVKELSLDAYVNQTVLIGFRGVSKYGNNIFFDYVQIQSYVDAQVSAITVPPEGTIGGAPITPQVTVKNNGGMATDIPVTAEIWTAPAVLIEGFEGTTFPPTGWVVYNADNGTQQWSRNTTYPRTGTAAASCRYESSTLQNNDWLVTPRITVQPNAVLKFWYRNTSTSTPSDQLVIRLSTTDNAITSFTTVLDSFSVSTLTYTEKVISLNSYAGQNVYIAFVNRGLYAWTLLIDDVYIGPEPQLLYTAQTTVPNVPGLGGTGEAYFTPQWTPPATGTYLFKAYTTLTGDMNPANDLMTRTFSVDLIPPAVPTLTSPANNSRTNDQTPRFEWSQVADAVQYHILVDDDNNFGSPAIDEYTSNTYWEVQEGDELGEGTYYWKVQAKDAYGNWSNFSTPWS